MTMSLETLGVIVAIVLGVIGLIVQVVAIGIYIGKLDGYKVLTDFRFNEVNKKLDKHNNFVERVYKLEGSAELAEEQIKVANHRIEDLEKGN